MEDGEMKAMGVSNPGVVHNTSVSGGEALQTLTTGSF
jgi:hypothetical protein